MDKSLYETLDGSKILSRDAWAWIHLNQRKKDDEAHHILIELEEINQLEQDVKLLMKQCISWQRDYRYKYDEIFLESVSNYCGSYSDTKQYLVGKRLETEEELLLRLSKVDKINKDKESKELEKKSAEELKEKKLLQKLKEKYEN